MKPISKSLVVCFMLACVSSIMLFGCRSEEHHNPAVIESDIRMLFNALNSYKSRAGHYPSEQQGLQVLVNEPTIAPKPDKWIQLLREIPIDPWGRPYEYALIAGRVHLWSMGKSEKSIEDDIHVKE